MVTIGYSAVLAYLEFYNLEVVGLELIDAHIHMVHRFYLWYIPVIYCIVQSVSYVWQSQVENEHYSVFN